MAIYVMTCPLSHMTGIFYLPIPTICHDTGLSLTEANESIKRLTEDGFLTYDEASECVFVTELARCQIGSTLSPNDKRLKSVVTQIEKVSKSPLIDAFYQRYSTHFPLPKRDPKQTLAPKKHPQNPLQEGASSHPGRGFQHTPMPLLEVQEARSDQNRSDIHTSASPPAESSPSRIDPKKFLEEWNRAVPFAKARVIEGNRLKSIKARAKEPLWLAEYPEALAKIADSPFLRGEGAQGWKADIDWFLRPGSVTLILEGKYDRHSPAQATTEPPARREVTDEELRELDRQARIKREEAEHLARQKSGPA